MKKLVDEEVDEGEEVEVPFYVVVEVLFALSAGSFLTTIANVIEPTQGSDSLDGVCDGRGTFWNIIVFFLFLKVT